MTARLAEIRAWITGLYPNQEINALASLESDASARKYHRCSLNGEAFVIMDTVPGQEQVNFVKVANILSQNNINAPKIIHNNLEQGLILMNDFGDHTYLNVLKKADPDGVNQLYLDAINSLIQMQRIAKASTDLAVMDDAYIENRLQVFKTWYLQQHLKLAVDSRADAVISDLYQIFSNAFTELPQVFVHVDYHCRNLMHLDNSNNPGILDFQDAMFGPMTYDLVSLFQDAYITWPRKQVEAWAKIYHDRAVDAGLLEPKEFNVFMRNFDLVGLQRHIKNLGVFARLKHRDNKSAYLNSIPTLLTYIMATCNRYSELTELDEFLHEHVGEYGSITTTA